MGPIISIVVPVYNVEKYLSTCFDSLLNQGLDMSDYEIILVNDGSKDESLEICNQYAKTYSNISVFSQENQGVSMARNHGLSKAKGEWVMFVDSDDYICKGSLKYLLDHFCSDNYDGIRFWTRIKSDAVIDKSLSCDGEILFSGNGFEFIKNYGLETFSITTLYRRDYLQNHNIKFTPFKIGEDFLFASQFLLSNPRICSTSSIVYQYLIHPGSASTSRNKTHARKCTYDHLEVNKILVNSIEQINLRNNNPEVYNKCIGTIQGKLPLIFSRLLSSDINTKEFREIVKDQKSISILPMKRNSGSLKIKISPFLINGLSSLPLLFPIAKAFYSNIFVPFILPKLDRDR